ncbi:MAG TPA: cob(I)yrinic acid a,c-diamide adenosyltransferase [Candidatus Limnocylindrales bacterium]|nr:cob(I)yrinic acid a,c-diamide adenosyltransferase [Candidatus Limnocylindrales bacterium]
MSQASATDAAAAGSELPTEPRETRKGVLLVITGNGKGKTTSAFGTALRGLGHGFKIAVVQFMKGRIYGELEVLRDRLGVDVYQFGRNAFVDPKNPDPRDLELARQGLDKAWEIVRGQQHDLLILDEIIYVSSYGLLPETEVLALARSRPRWMDLILTGRGASAELIELADTVSDVREIKHHYKKGIESRAGMEY